jgi:hypothetical protein
MADHGAVRVVSQLSPAQCDKMMHLVNHCAVWNADQCLVVDVNRSSRLSLNSKGYVQIKVPTDPDHCLQVYRTPTLCQNKKVQLHQLVMWTASLEGVHLHRSFITEASLEMSHLCGNKACANENHLWPEPSSVNKSRNFCEVVVVVNETVLNVCRHVPRCVLTQHKRDRALKLKWT